MSDTPIYDQLVLERLDTEHRDMMLRRASRLLRESMTTYTMTPDQVEKVKRGGLTMYSGRLTREDALAAVEKLRGPVKMQACGVTRPHVVHPDATGETFCANCGARVTV